jgi:hypothetical protein
MKVRLVDSVEVSGSSDVIKLYGPWGDVQLAKAIKEIDEGTRRYRAVIEKEFDLELDEKKESLILNAPITTAAQMPSRDQIRDAGERAATRAAVVAASVLRLAVVVTCALFASMGRHLPVPLRWSLGVMAMFVLFHLLLDLLWFWLHRD